MYLNMELDASDKGIKSVELDKVLDLQTIPVTKKQIEVAEDNTTILVALGRYYHYLKITKNIQKFEKESIEKKGKKETPILLLVPMDKFEKGKIKVLKRGEDVQILEFDSKDHSFDEGQEWEKTYYMVVAAPQEMVDREKGLMVQDLRITRTNTWVLYYQLKKTV